MKSATWKVIAASMVAGQLLSPVLMGVQGRPPFAPEQLPVVILAGLPLGAWILFSAWTWRRLGRMREGNGRQIYNWGVLGWGLPMWLTLSLSSASREAGGFGNAFSWAFATELLIAGLINFPLALWGGWFFGWVLTAALGTPGRTSPLPPASPGGTPSRH